LGEIKKNPQLIPRLLAARKFICKYFARSRNWNKWMKKVFGNIKSIGMDSKK